MKAAFLLAAGLLLVASVANAEVPCQVEVVKKDSLSKIAEEYGLEVEALIELNSQIADPNLIYPGDFVYLPCEPATRGKSVADLLANRPDTRIVLQAAVAAGFAETLSDKNFEATVFIPNDDAFLALLDALNTTAADLLNNTGLVADVLSYHVVPGVAAKAADLYNDQVLDTLEGDTLKVNLEASAPRLFTSSKQKVRIIETDLKAGDAIVHIVKEVLLPELECEHVVEEGEFLYAIAEEYGLSLEELLKQNPTIEDPELIKPGETITVPCVPK